MNFNHCRLGLVVCASWVRYYSTSAKRHRPLPPAGRTPVSGF